MTVTVISPLDRTSPTFKTDVDALFMTKIPLLSAELSTLQADVGGKQLIATGAAADATAAAAAAVPAAATAVAAKNIAVSLKPTQSATAPPSPIQDSQWFDTTTGRKYIWYVSNTGGQWVESGGGVVDNASAVTELESGLIAADFPVGFRQGSAAPLTTTAQVVRQLNYRGTTITAFGDSFTFGIDASGSYTTENYINFISRTTGMPVVNKAISGGLIIDLGAAFYNTVTTANDVFVTMTGYNDGRVYGTSANGLATYRGVLRAMLVWLALPSAAKIMANDPTVTLTGTWSTMTGVYAGKATGKLTTAPGSKATVAVKGDTLYIGLTRSTSTPAFFKVEIDGRDYGNFNNSAWTASNSGMAYGPDVLRISGLPSSKLHSVSITHISGGAFYLDYISGNGGANVAFPCPSVFSGNAVRMRDYSHELSSDAVVDAFNTVHRQVVAELASDGLNVMHVDTCSGYDPFVHGSTNPLEVHPTLVGEQYLSNTFLQAMSQDSKPVDKNRRLERYQEVPGLYLASPTGETPVAAGAFAFIDFNTFTAPPGWVFDIASERSYYPQVPGYVELTATVTFKAPLAAGRYYFEIFNGDNGAVHTLFDEMRAASSEALTRSATITLPVDGVATRFRVRVYSTVAATIAGGNVVTRFSGKFLGR